MHHVMAVVGIHNEEGTAANTLRQLHRAGVDAIVAIENGSVDNSYPAIQNVASQVGCEIYLERFAKPLGHDVSRAIGTYKALRITPKDGLLVYVDADWGASFGPNLEMFIERAKQTDADVYSVSWAAVSTSWRYNPAATLWRQILAMQNVVPHDAAPFLLPMTIRTAVFRNLSPSLLAHPGLWFAAVVDAYGKWRTDDNWSLDMIGHKTRSRWHSKSMARLLEQDAKDALLHVTRRTAPVSILSALGRQPTKAQMVPSLPTRDLETLLRYAAGGTFAD